MNRELLEQPFPDEAIRKRKGFNGEMLDYVEAHTVIQRLNDVFESKWSFAVVDRGVKDDEVVVLAMLEAGGISKMQFGSAKLTRTREEGNLVSLGDDHKAAATDALKKCATLMGVGLYLHGNGQGNGAAPPQSPSTSSDNGAAPKAPTEAQFRAISAIARSHQMQDEEVRNLCAEKFGVEEPKYLSRQEASDLIRHLQSIGRG